MTKTTSLPVRKSRVPRLPAAPKPPIDIPPLALDIRDRLLATVEASRFDFEPEQRLSSTGHCLRQQWYAITGAQTNEVQGGSTWEMRDGDIHEADVKRWLREAGYEITAEHEVDGRNVGDTVHISLPDGTAVEGHIDGLIVGPGLYVPHLLEIKSMSYLRYASALRDGIKQSNRDYYLQVQGYLGALDLPACIFAIKAKDSSATKRMVPPGGDPKFHVEVIDFDPEAFQDVYERQGALRLHIIDGSEPVREYERSDWHCNWCPFMRTCWGE